ncbi:MAG TPA: FAD-dependent thymidylate synthase [Gemmatimonadetes bacterium]|jgi:thymidylate synthase (FAD)|nr:FAD-dependent thymidylate synthase [Gemmatimonadota bacterium]HIB08727.1 FAD-dependent thymidylate synthase [Gemmatimonadota bacterium]HIN77466.1 FAD-dependent thymidylate synthase [Gemmatimonadota bacterium]
MSVETKRPTVEAAEEILGGYFPALDHGFVALVDYMGTDEDVERAARVSYGAGTRKVSLTRGLIRYLRRHRHTTPSEMVEFKFHCAMPMFIARQWVRHRSASINEYSGRYSLMPLLFYMPDEEHFALQSRSNRQGREKVAPAEIYEAAVERWDRIRAEASGGYAWMIGEDIAREIARIDLPLSTYTQWYWKIDLHNLLHFLSLRADPHAQWEIRVFAEIIAGMVKRVAPLSFEAWVDYDLLGRSLSRAELNVLGELLDVDEESVSARSGRSFSSDHLKKMGLSAREIEEFAGKLRRPSLTDFELDLSTMRKAEDVQSEMHEAVPGDFE